MTSVLGHGKHEACYRCADSAVVSDGFSKKSVGEADVIVGGVGWGGAPWILK